MPPLVTEVIKGLSKSEARKIKAAKRAKTFLGGKRKELISKVVRGEVEARKDPKKIILRDREPSPSSGLKGGHVVMTEKGGREIYKSPHKANLDTVSRADMRQSHKLGRSRGTQYGYGLWLKKLEEKTK